MEQLNIFVSSTFYNLQTERDVLSKKILDLGHKAICHETKGIFYNPDSHTHVSCITAVEETADVLLLIIDSRFGGEAVPTALAEVNLQKIKNISNFKEFFSGNHKYSITQCEVLKAIELGIPVITFVKKDVSDTRQMYERLKKQGKHKNIPFFKDDKESKNASYIFDFIKFINNLQLNNGAIDYTKLDEITDYLKEYLSAYFKKLLKEKIKQQHRSTNASKSHKLIPSQIPIDSIIDYFGKNSTRQRSIQTINNKIAITESGSAIIYSTISVKPIDPLHHHYYQIYTDKPGNIEIEEFRVIGLLNETDYFGVMHDRHLRLNLFFKEPKAKKTEFTIILKLNAENYLSDLIEKGLGELQKKLSDGSKKFESITETITFPNTPFFKRLKIKIAKHPEKNMIGTFVKSQVKGANKVFNVNFERSDKSPFNEDIKIELTLR